MLIHKGECGGNIVVDISRHIAFLVSFGVGASSLTMGMGDIQFNGPDIVEPDFFCTGCKEVIEVNNINVMCHHCGNIVNVGDREAWKPNSVGGVYCRHCLDTHFESISYKNLETIMRKMDLRG